MMMDIAEKKNSDITKLVLAKKIYIHGCAHASEKDPVSLMLAVHHFDNAVEMVLKCIATKFGVATLSKRDPGFGICGLKSKNET